MPVLRREVTAQLDLRPGLIAVDGTVGAGGHSREILTHIQPGGRLIGLDRDPMMLAHAGRVLSGPNVQLIHSSYRDLRTVLDELGISTADRVLLDLGLSSDQLADQERGFGFDAGGRLDMRFDPSQGESAANWLANVSEEELATALREYGEIPNARQVAAAIVAARNRRRIETAEDLCEAVNRMTGGDDRRRSDRSAVAPLFQAIRIAVNGELVHLQDFLEQGLPACVAEGGRVGIISFHSIEDRLVKQALRPAHGWEPVAKKPIEPTPAEVRVNPRSRSARLRVAIRAKDTAT